MRFFVRVGGSRTSQDRRGRREIPLDPKAGTAYRPLPIGCVGRPHPGAQSVERQEVQGEVVCFPGSRIRALGCVADCWGAGAGSLPPDAVVMALTRLPASCADGEGAVDNAHIRRASVVTTRLEKPSVAMTRTCTSSPFLNCEVSSVYEGSLSPTPIVFHVSPWSVLI